MTQTEIDEALERSDEIAELQDTRVLAAAYRAEKARAERAEQVLATEHDLWVQAEAERDAADESCRMMSDRLERLVEANMKMRAALERIATAANGGMPWQTFAAAFSDMARVALGKEG